MSIVLDLLKQARAVEVVSDDAISTVFCDKASNTFTLTKATGVVTGKDVKGQNIPLSPDKLP